MQFDDNQPIYMQISRWISDKILRGEWHEGERIPSVRESGVLLQVNPNTVMRAYEALQGREVIYNQRGIGYFVSPGAANAVRTAQREEFLGGELPRLFERMMLLDVSINMLAERFEQYQSTVNDYENKQ